MCPAPAAWYGGPSALRDTFDRDVVTVVIVPRERFDYTETSLESVLAHTRHPHRLIVVDGGSPKPVKRYLARRSQSAGFTLIREDRYLSPTQARNIGLSAASSEYVVFLDNDVIVEDGWLEALVMCAAETGATAVSPLLCQGDPSKHVVHCAGGLCEIRESADGRRLVEEIFHQGTPTDELRPDLSRGPAGIFEFHAVLLRRAFFDEHGLLDEQLLSTKEHLDLCLRIREAGGTVFLEPSATVTYVPAGPVAWSDLPYYLLRWSDAWGRATMDRLQDKWRLTPTDPYYDRIVERHAWRRRQALLTPALQRMLSTVTPVRKVLGRAERWMNRTFTSVRR